MKNYLYVVNKNMTNTKNNTKEIINNIKECNHEFKTYFQNDIESYFYTNENINVEVKNHEYFFGFSGQLADSFDDIKNEITSAGRGNEKNIISKLAGANSISFFHLPTEVIEAYNSYSGVNPVFYCENDEKIVIGVDPLVVNCVAYNTNKPLFDLSNISSFLMMGYYFSHDTLFKNVKSIPHNSFIAVKNNKLLINKIDNSVDNMFKEEPTKHLYEDITEAYLKSFDVIPDMNQTLNVGLTGGKDSRLIALGLAQKDIEFNAITRGDMDHPDVQVAKLLAEKLNLNHTVKQPVNKQVNQMKINLVDKILKTMIGSNGLLYGYENIKYSTKYIGNIGITGVGAEAIRGGFGITRAKEVDNISDFLLSAYFPYQDIVLPKYKEKYQNELIQIGDQASSLREIGNKLFIEFYNGKRTGAARAALSYYNNSLSPFFDSNFLKQATRINIDEIANEKVHFNIMSNLNSEVAMLPFANDRWSFEKKGPLKTDDFKGWIERQPVMAKTKRGGYNWRLFRNKDKIFTDAFKSLLLDGGTSEIYEVVDYEKIKKIFSGNVSGNYNRVLWGLLSIKLYMEYFENKPMSIANITLKLPESTEMNVQQPKIYDLLDSIISLNDKLIINDDQKFEVSVNQESDKFGYLIVGNGNLTTPSSDNVGEKFILDKNKKSISVRFCLDILDNLADISLYIMFFDKNGKRIHSKEYKQDIVDGINYLGKTFKGTDDAWSIKFAIKIKSNTDKPVLVIKYGYMKYN